MVTCNFWAASAAAGGVCPAAVAAVPASAKPMLEKMSKPQAHGLKGKYIEIAIWQSWVWFTKVKLDDPHGYCGGLKVTRDGVAGTAA